MRTFVCLLLLAGLSVSAGEFIDHSVGLKMSVPDGWERDTAREKGSIKFSGTYSVTREKYVTLVVEAVSAAGFSADNWLSNEKKFKASRFIAEVSTEFKADRKTRIGGLDAVGYVFGGKSKNRSGSVRFKVYGVVRGGTFFQITESSFNGAHEAAADQLKEIWNGIMFQEDDEGDANEEEGGDEGARAVTAVTGDPVKAEDKLGNYATMLPPGWEVAREAPLNADVQRRMTFIRKDQMGNVIASIEIFKILWQSASDFHTGTPDDILQNISKQGFFEGIYGQGSKNNVHPQMDEGIGFGDASKAGGFEMRSLTMEQMAKVVAAEQKIRKGIKGVKKPEFKPRVVRGRLAMISPNIYLTRCDFVASLADDPQLVAEYNKIHDDLKFLVTKAAPPPLEVLGRKIGDTLGDPAYAKARKEKAALQLSARKAYRIEYTITLPPGFVLFDKKAGPNITAIVYAQDKHNNWVQITVVNDNAKKISEENKKFGPPDELAQTWKSNWTAKARGAKVPSKVQKFSLGKVRGKGYKLLEGKVSGFAGTFSGVVSDKFPGKGWRTIIEVETRGNPDVWKDSIKKFFKALKAKDVKVK